MISLLDRRKTIKRSKHAVDTFEDLKREPISPEKIAEENAIRDAAHDPRKGIRVSSAMSEIELPEEAWELLAKSDDKSSWELARQAEQEAPARILKAAVAITAFAAVCVGTIVYSATHDEVPPPLEREAQQALELTDEAKACISRATLKFEAGLISGSDLASESKQCATENDGNAAVISVIQNDN